MAPVGGTAAATAGADGGAASRMGLLGLRAGGFATGLISVIATTSSSFPRSAEAAIAALAATFARRTGLCSAPANAADGSPTTNAGAASSLAFLNAGAAFFTFTEGGTTTAAVRCGCPVAGTNSTPLIGVATLGGVAPPRAVSGWGVSSATADEGGTLPGSGPLLCADRPRLRGLRGPAGGAAC